MGGKESKIREKEEMGEIRKRKNGRKRRRKKVR